ncbi:chondroadherin-like [Periplaneta americana]|uniref:chondroadherin-like n=1 Tax=Periplaneta americana TaxID=6978 RepID=UPI0037E77776
MSSRSRIISVALLLLAPALIFWMWLLTLAIHSSWFCPHGCWCDPEQAVLDCSHAALKQLPHVYHSPTYKVNLDHNNLSELGKKIFTSKNIFRIEELSLSNCNILYIDVDAFNGLVLLGELSLRHNLFTELKVGTFENMTNMNGLHLANNRIENLEIGIFEGLVSLEWLNLEHNLLNSLRSDAFVGLNNLNMLWLSHNRLSTLHPDVFVHMTKLNYLYLNGNEELQIPSNSYFLNIQTVEELYISDCNISLVTPKSFENATRLRVLDLRNNHLKTIDENIFIVLPRLTDLLLYGNPLECDCGLLDVWRWCQEHDIEVGKKTEILRCESPEQVSGMWWGVLGKAQCTNQNITFQEGYKAVIPNSVKGNDFYFARYDNIVKYVQLVIYIFLFIFGAIGNVVVLVVIIFNSEKHTMSNVYIINLALSDLISVTVDTILSYIEDSSESWQLGELLCKMFGFLRSCNTEYLYISYLL